MKQHYLIVLLPFFFLSPPSANAQTLNYDVYYGDSQVGSMKVVRTQEDGKEILYSHGTVTLSLIFTLELEFSHRAEFEGGNLLASLTKNLRSGDLTDLSSGYRNGSEYRNRVNDELKRASLPIRHTVLTMYFSEPKGLKRIYSERTGVHMPVRCIKPGHYETTQSGGHKTRYIYRNGLVSQMEVDHSIATLVFRLRQ